MYPKRNKFTCNSYIPVYYIYDIYMHIYIYEAYTYVMQVLISLTVAGLLFFLHILYNMYPKKEKFARNLYIPVYIYDIHMNMYIHDVYT